MSLSTNMLIDLFSQIKNTTNSIIITEAIEQYYGLEVSIDYVEYYLEKYGLITREHGESTNYLTYITR